MSQFLTVDERKQLDPIPESDLVELVVELDILIPESLSRDGLLELAVQGLTALAHREGLPFSAYDKDDLLALDDEHRAALAKACGAENNIESILKEGKNVYKTYRKHRSKSQVAMLLPMFIPPLARYIASEPVNH